MEVPFIQLVDFCFGECSKSQRKQIEYLLLHDENYFDTISGINRIKRELQLDKSATLKHFEDTKERLRLLIFN